MNDALIAAAATLMVCLINNFYSEGRFEKQLEQQRKESEKKHDETIGLVLYRLEQLEKKQDKYNNIINRTYELEAAEEVIREKIEHLEQFHK